MKWCYCFGDCCIDHSWQLNTETAAHSLPPPMEQGKNGRRVLVWKWEVLWVRSGLSGLPPPNLLTTPACSLGKCRVGKKRKPEWCASSGGNTSEILHWDFESLIQEGFWDMRGIHHEATLIVRCLDCLFYMRQGEGAGGCLVSWRGG